MTNSLTHVTGLSHGDFDSFNGKIVVPGGVAGYMDYCKSEKLDVASALNWHMAPDWVSDHPTKFIAAYTGGYVPEEAVPDEK